MSLKIVTGADKHGVANVSSDYKLEVDVQPLVIMDHERFNYSAQNTGKFTYSNTTMTAGFATTGFDTNHSAITTTTTGVTVGTYTMFPVFGNLLTQCETNLSFSAQPAANVVIDFGLFLRGSSTDYAPLDGMYFRLTSEGLFGVINNAGTETLTNVINVIDRTETWTYTNSHVYSFMIKSDDVKTSFWIDGLKYAEIDTPSTLDMPTKAEALPWSVRQAHTGTAGAAMGITVNSYEVSVMRTSVAETMGVVGNRVLGSYQGLSGGTMGSLTSYTNSTNPTAAVPSNTALAANLPSGLGGQAWETFTLALNTDGILMSYQVPAGSTTVQGRRLKVSGVKMSAFVQTILAGGPANSIFTLNYGHTAASLATSEAAATKARRVVMLPELTQAITVNQAVNTMISQPGGMVSMFTEPIYVNPGEFISLSVKHIGTVGTSGTIAYNIQYIYSWE